MLSRQMHCVVQDATMMLQPGSIVSSRGCFHVLMSVTSGEEEGYISGRGAEL